MPTIYPFFLDLYFCYYTGAATILTDGHCYIQYNKLIDYYLTMWSPGQLNPSALNGELFRCTNNQDAIDDVHWCKDNVFTNSTGFNISNYFYCTSVSII